MEMLEKYTEYEKLDGCFEPTAFEQSLLKTEAQMNKMLASPAIEVIVKHDAMLNSFASPPVLHALEMQQNILNNFPSQLLIESATRSLQDSPMFKMAETIGKVLESYHNQYGGIGASLAKAIQSSFSQFSISEDAVRCAYDGIKRFSLAFEQVVLATTVITDSFLRGISAIANEFSKFDFSPMLNLTDNLSRISSFHLKNDVLNNFGWYLISELPEEIVEDIYTRRDEITQEEVDALVVQHFRNNRCHELKRMICSWKKLPYFKARQIVFHEAQVCHSRRSFNASTTLLSLHFEGVVTDFVRNKLNKPTYRAEKALECIYSLADDLSTRAMPFGDWIACAYVLGCVDEAFRTNFSPADPDDCPNTSRHKIAHGHATAKETEANSLRRFLFMNELFKLFCCLENEYQLAS